SRRAQVRLSTSTAPQEDPMPEDNGELQWEKDGDEFDAEAAKKLIHNLRDDKKTLHERLKYSNTKTKNAGSTNSELQTENDRLNIQIQTGLNDRQVARLVGDTLEEKLADAEAYAEETGIELRSFFDSEAEGTPGDPAGAEDEEDEEKPTPGMNYRAPAQKQQGI